MREIKFRAFYEKRYYRYVGVTPTSILLYSDVGNKLSVLQVVGEIGKDCDDIQIEQFTGLHDKNSKEIYEGDIVVTDYGTGPVEYSGVGFSVDCDSISEYWETSQSIEVIGNIHENEGLLA